ncbi:glycosyltransferase [Paenarthrobacter ureafaciens]|uniref:glycosyltransferase n=1 Tax=Paenarthrobacter ureafaciens TaxID=37931 RepID=UPI002DBA87BE|nr:glycosyltransferase [Paenarthrobacter ureafaciens]MEC3850804.1 glycosyltransferase [Paenarthrobacter ureafaciens]
MKIALFDGIVETHVASSLERALVAAGHQVLNTGKVGHGYKFATGRSQLHTLSNALDTVVDFQPDVIFVFRPASLPSPLLERAKRTGARMVAWLSDDPVLWDLSYGPVVDSYDIVLHCGTARVLDFYESMFGRPTGINFPFWTDQTAFPYVYGSQPRESDAMFLGNVHDEVRRTRYFDLGSLSSSIRIHGNVGRDYFNIAGGFLDSDAEVVDAGARAGLAVNIPQYFRDHQGLETWFDGLDKLGFFQYPSRVIQYAAMGIPIISVVPDADDLASFPEIVCVDSIAQLDSAIQGVLASPSLQDLSKATHERFLRNYSAAARVMALESVLSDDSWKTLDSRERSLWFTQFDAVEAGREEAREAAVVESDNRREVIEVSRTVEPRCIGVLGVGFGRVTSTSSVTVRTLQALGHRVNVLDLSQYKSVLVPDPNNEYKFVINAVKFLEAVKERPDLLVVSNLDCGVTQAGREQLLEAGVRLAVIGVESAKGGKKLERLAGRVDYLGVLNPQVADGLKSDHFDSVEHLPHLVDRGFLNAIENVPVRGQQAVVAGKRRLHFSKQAAAFRDLADWPSTELFIEESPEEYKDLDMLAAALKSTVVVAPFDASVPGPLPSEVLPFALAAGSLVVVPRGVGPMNICEPGTASVSVREKGELALKLSRLASSPGSTARILAAAEEVVSGPLNAEHRLAAMMDQIFAEPSGGKAIAGTVVDGQQDAGLVPEWHLGYEQKSLSLAHQRIKGKGTDLVVTVDHRVTEDTAGLYQLVVSVEGAPAYVENLRMSPTSRHLRIRIPKTIKHPTVSFGIRTADKSVKPGPGFFPSATVSNVEWVGATEAVHSVSAVSTSPWGA